MSADYTIIFSLWWHCVRVYYSSCGNAETAARCRIHLVLTDISHYDLIQPESQLESFQRANTTIQDLFYRLMSRLFLSLSTIFLVFLLMCVLSKAPLLLFFLRNFRRRFIEMDIIYFWEIRTSLSSTDAAPGELRIRVHFRTTKISNGKKRICITQKNIDMSPGSCEIFTCLLRFFFLVCLMRCKYVFKNSKHFLGSV